VVFVVHTLEHERFKRHGSNLFTNRTITLTESLCGFKYALKHVDGTTLLIESTDITRHNSTKVIKGAGMPHKDNKSLHGDLYIVFKVEFPECVTAAQQEGLEQYLPPKPVHAIAPDARPVKLCASNVDANFAAGTDAATAQGTSCAQS
jgi:DnaJ family protein A protein 2